MIPSTDLRPIPDGCIPIDRSLWIWRPILGTSYPAVVHSVVSHVAALGSTSRRASLSLPAGQTCRRNAAAPDASSGYAPAARRARSRPRPAPGPQLCFDRRPTVRRLPPVDRPIDQPGRITDTGTVIQPVRQGCVRPSTEFEHVTAQKKDSRRGGWLNSREARSARVNAPGNTTGACKPCNASQQNKDIGTGPGEWWPPAWPTCVWWLFGRKP
jgi:hypothetical protein